MLQNLVLIRLLQLLRINNIYEMQLTIAEYILHMIGVVNFGRNF